MECLKISETIWHPDYDQEDIYGGFNIGVALVGKVLKGKNFVLKNQEATHDYFSDTIEPEDLQEGGQEVEIVGFPSEEPKKGVLHKHADKVCTAIRGPKGGCTVT